MRKEILCALALVVALTSLSLAQTKKKRPLPYEYGRVIISESSMQAEQPPVVFEHWIHRSKFTCSVCHVDLGFAMKAGATGIRSVDIINGYYCGACHNGKMVNEGKVVFQACSRYATDDNRARCERCHSFGKTVRSDYDFASFSKPLPKERFGNGLDWEKAEQMRLITPADFVEGLSIKRKSLTAQSDFALSPKVLSMPDIIFSHKKHTDWNGCELCHPEIFVGVKKGASKYSMVDIFEGRSCGVCHTSVAFPLTDCQRCHSKPVQP